MDYTDIKVLDFESNVDNVRKIYYLNYFSIIKDYIFQKRN